MTENEAFRPNLQPELFPPAEQSAPGPNFDWNQVQPSEMKLSYVYPSAFPFNNMSVSEATAAGGGPGAATVADAPAKSGGPGTDATTTSDETAGNGTEQPGEQLGPVDRQLLNTQFAPGDGGGSEPYDKRWDSILNDPRIDRSQSDKTDGQGHELWNRSVNEVQTIEVRQGRKDGDPPANYVIHKDGTVEEKIPPDKKAMGEGDDQITIQYGDDSDGDSSGAPSPVMAARANELIAEIQAQAAYAGLAPDIPDDIMSMLHARTAPSPRAVPRMGPAGARTVPGFSNGGNYMGPSAPEGGGFAKPPIPSRAPSGEVHAAVKAADSKFDGSSIKDSSVRKIVQDVVGKNEGHPTSINWNDNGHGISVGIFQWNQKSGELPMLLQRMAKDHPEEFKKAFGADAENMQKESFIRTANISPNSRLGAEMQTALNDPVLQQTEVQLAGEKVQNCAGVAAKHGVTSEAGTAMFVDLVNQFGMGDEKRGAMKYLLAAENHGGSEEQKFQTLDASSRRDSHWRADRNPKVVQEIKEANLSFQQGSMLGGADGSQSA